MTAIEANDLAQTGLLLVLLGLRTWPVIVRLAHRFRLRWPIWIRPEPEVVEAVVDVDDQATTMAGLVAEEAKRRMWLINTGSDNVA